MKSVNNLLRCYPFPISSYGYRYTVLIRPADIDYIGTFKSVISYEYIGRQIGSAQMSKMNRPVSIGQCGSNKYSFFTQF